MDVEEVCKVVWKKSYQLLDLIQYLGSYCLACLNLRNLKGSFSRRILQPREVWFPEARLRFCHVKVVAMAARTRSHTFMHFRAHGEAQSLPGPTEASFFEATVLPNQPHGGTCLLSLRSHKLAMAIYRRSYAGVLRGTTFERRKATRVRDSCEHSKALACFYTHAPGHATRIITPRFSGAWSWSVRRAPCSLHLALNRRPRQSMTSARRTKRLAILL